MKVLFIRHGQTATNVTGQVHARGDTVTLDSTGVAQAHKVADVCRQFGVTVVYDSPERRSADTAKIIADATHARIKECGDLAERNWGGWSGWSWEDIKARLDAMTLDQRFRFVPPGGESWKEMNERLRRVIDEISHGSAEVAAVVAHGGCLRALLPILDDEPLEASFQYELHNGSITEYELQRDGAPKRLSIDDTRHLAGS